MNLNYPRKSCSWIVQGSGQHLCSCMLQSTALPAMIKINRSHLERKRLEAEGMSSDFPFWQFAVNFSYFLSILSYLHGRWSGYLQDCMSWDISAHPYVQIEGIAPGLLNSPFVHSSSWAYDPEWTLNGLFKAFCCTDIPQNIQRQYKEEQKHMHKYGAYFVL